MTTAVATSDASLVPARIDFTEDQIETIAKVICVDSEGHTAPPAFVALFLAACRHTGLDPFLKQIWALKVQNKWTMFVGVDGYRVASFRTGLDDGMDGPEFSDDGETWYDYPFKAKPNFCRVGVWRKGVNRPFVTTLRMDSRINERSPSWVKDPAGMLAKCCESLSRRKAFPADVAIFDDAVEVEDVEVGAPMTRAEVPEGQYRELPETATDSPQNGHIERMDEAARKLQETMQKNADAAPAKAPVRRAAAKAKDAPEAPVAQEQPSDDVPPPEEPSFSDQRVAEFAGDAEVVARPEPPQGENQSITNPPLTKAQEMSKFWVAAKKFEKDTAKITAASKEHFGAPPAELEGARRAQLIALLETGELPADAEPQHEASMTYTEDGQAVCEHCGQPCDEETGLHA